MTLRDFLLALAGVTVFSWLAWLTVILYIDPTAAGVVGILVFYASLFFSLVGTFSLLGLGARVLSKRLNQEKVIAFRYVSPSIRQAIWFSCVVIISLVLLAANLFAWWSVALLLLALAVLEGFYLLKSIESNDVRRT